MLDRLGQSHSPTERLYWEKFVELNITYGNDGILTVNIVQIIQLLQFIFFKMVFQK